MNKKVFILGNPKSGRKRLAPILSDLKSYLDTQQIGYSFCETSKDGLDEIKELLDNSYTHLTVIGGDGTINQAVNALNLDIPIGIIPAGTGNDFVKNVDLGSNRLAQFETAIHGDIKPIDLGICNGQKFVNGVGIGFDGQIVEDMASKRVPLLKGFAAYYYHVLRILASYQDRPFDYSIDGQSFQKNLILLTVGNGTTFGGGFKLTPYAKIDDGKLDVCEIGEFSAFKRFANIHRLSNGSHDKLEAVSLYQSETVKIDANQRLFAHIDGERMGQPPFEIKIIPKAMNLRIAQIL